MMKEFAIRGHKKGATIHIGTTIDLNLTEVQVLEYMLGHPEHALSAWKDMVGPTFESFMSELRSKLASTPMQPFKLGRWCGSRSFCWTVRRSKTKMRVRILS